MEKNRLLWWGVAAIAIVGIIWFVAAKRAETPEGATNAPTAAPAANPDLSGEVTIGAILPLTGDAASYGLPIQKAMDLAVDEINAANGVGGKRLVVAVEDGMCDPKEAATAGQKLINVTGVKIVLGGVCSGETSGFLGTANEKRVVAISPSATSPDLSAGGDDYFFRFAPSDALAGKVAAAYARETLGKTRAAVISETTDYAQGLRRVFTEEFRRLGGTVAVDETYNKGQTDFRTQALKIKNADVDVVYLVPQGDAPGIAATKALKDQQVGATVLTAEILIGPKLVADNAEALDGIIGFEAHFDETTERAGRFAEKYRARYGEDLAYPFFMANMYSMVYLAKDLIEAHGEDGAAMQRTLSSLTEWDGGALADVTLDRNGDVAWRSYAIKEARGGQVMRKEIYTLE